MWPALEIKQSKIAGSGVFTTQPIRAGVEIMKLKGERCTIDEMIRRVNEGLEEESDPLGIDNEVYLDLDEFSRTFNHSCDPNAYIRGESDLVAMRDIAQGEEITYDYSTTMNDNEEKIEASGREVWTCACRCGSRSCRGVIDQFKRLPKERRDFYIKNKLMPTYMYQVFSKSIN